MRLQTLIWTCLVALAAVSAALGLFVLTTVLTEPAPAFPSETLNRVASDVQSAMSEAAMSRQTALEMVAAGPREPEIPSAGFRSGIMARSLDDAVGAIEKRLVEAEESGSTSSARLSWIPADVVNDVLDRADSLYSRRVRQSSDLAVEILRSSLAQQSLYYIRYLGFLELKRAVERDLLSYRELNSLVFNDVKSAFYGTESDISRERVDALAARSHAEVDKAQKRILADYSVLLDELVAESAAELGREQESLDLDGVNETVSAVRTLLATMSGPSVSGQAQAVPGADVTFDFSSWLEAEREELNEFRRATGLE